MNQLEYIDEASRVILNAYVEKVGFDQFGAEIPRLATEDDEAEAADWFLTSFADDIEEAAVKAPTDIFPTLRDLDEFGFPSHLATLDLIYNMISARVFQLIYCISLADPETDERNKIRPMRDTDNN